MEMHSMALTASQKRRGKAKVMVKYGSAFWGFIP